MRHEKHRLLRCQKPLRGFGARIMGRKVAVSSFPLMRHLVIVCMLFTCLPVDANDSLKKGGPIEAYIWIGNRSEELQIEGFLDRKPVISRSEEIKIVIEINPRPEDTDFVPLSYEVELHADCSGENPWTIKTGSIELPPTQGYASLSWVTCRDLALGRALVTATLYDHSTTEVLGEVSQTVTIVE